MADPSGTRPSSASCLDCESLATGPPTARSTATGPASRAGPGRASPVMAAAGASTTYSPRPSWRASATTRCSRPTPSSRKNEERRSASSPGRAWIGGRGYRVAVDDLRLAVLATVRGGTGRDRLDRTAVDGLVEALVADCRASRRLGARPTLAGLVTLRGSCLASRDIQARASG